MDLTQIEQTKLLANALDRASAMNEYWVLAFVITPALVAALGWGAAYLHMQSIRRQQRLHPGE